MNKYQAQLDEEYQLCPKLKEAPSAEAAKVEVHPEPVIKRQNPHKKEAPSLAHERF